VEIETALARLLAGYDHVLEFEPATDAGLRARPALKEVRLFKTSSRAVAPVVQAPRTPTANVAVLLEGLNDPDPTVHAASIEAPGGLGSEVPIDRVLAAGLGDHDPRGRLAVLTSGLTIPREVLFDRATNDASPIVRVEALAQLPRNDPRFEIVARTALADQDEACATSRGPF
jgi:hypothetical protein